jgi:hypothetical protein
MAVVIGTVESIVVNSGETVLKGKEGELALF